jgi:phospholipid transport system substrate-binding protein
MLKRIVLIVLMGIFTAAHVYANVTDEVKKTVDEVVRIVADKEMKKNEQIRRQALKQAISAIFDYTEMSKRSLGRYWNQRTPDERKQFVDLFATLLEKTYANKIESYHNEKIVYTKETTDGDYSEVKSTITNPSHGELTLDYRLINENAKWMVYDVVIEGVSLVSNYRGQFSRIISEHGYGELVKKLQTKNEENKAQ